MKAQWFTDPTDRYLRVVESMPAAPLPASVVATSRALDRGMLYDVIQTASADGKDITPTLVDYLAKHSALTESEAMPLVTALQMRNPAPKDLAAALSRTAVSRTISADVELSDPAMLGPLPRLLAAAVLAAAVLLSVVYAHGLPVNSGGWAYATFMFVAFVGAVGILVLVMGYKNVTIKGSGG